MTEPSSYDEDEIRRAPARGGARVNDELIPGLRGVSHAWAFWCALVAGTVLTLTPRRARRAPRRSSTARACARCSPPAASITAGAGTRAGARCCGGSTTPRSTSSSPRATRRSALLVLVGHDPDRRAGEHLGRSARRRRAQRGLDHRAAGARGGELRRARLGRDRLAAADGRPPRRRADRAVRRRRADLLGRRGRSTRSAGRTRGRARSGSTRSSTRSSSSPPSRTSWRSRAGSSPRASTAPGGATPTPRSLGITAVARPSVRILDGVVLPSETTTAELELPTFDPRALARRAALPLAAAAVAVAVLVLAGGPLHAFTDALRRALEADPRWVLAAVGFEILSFSGYIGLLWLVGERATPRMDLRASAQVTLAGAAVTRLLPTGGAGGVALTLWALRRTGLESKQATRTLLTFLVLLYAVFLLSIAVAGGLIAVGLAGASPAATSRSPPARRSARPPRWASPSPPRWCSRARVAASPAPPHRSATACVTRSRSCARPTAACSARRSGGRSTRPSCTACSTPSARPRRSPSSCSATSSAWSPTRSRSRARSAAAWSACCWPSASRRTSRSPRCSPTARWRSGSPPRSASLALGGLRRTVARWGAEGELADAPAPAPAASPSARHWAPGREPALNAA